MSCSGVRVNYFLQLFGIAESRNEILHHHRIHTHSSLSWARVGHMGGRYLCEKIDLFQEIPLHCTKSASIRWVIQGAACIVAWLEQRHTRIWINTAITILKVKNIRARQTTTFFPNRVI